jgi:NADPH:quinone reductase-like Zn-dependent oxidoreductase
MIAIVCRNDGSPDVVKYEEVEKPTAGDNQVLIKVRAASVNPLDGFPVLVAGIARRTAGLFKPKPERLGRDVAGQVEAVGKDVTRFKPGDEVFGACMGAFAEYACATEKNLVLKPANLSFEAAAAVPVAALTALQGLRDKGNIQRGQKVVVDGASGGVGTFAIQIAKSFEADVTAVCSTRNVDTAQSLGANQVIDYTREDFTKNGQRYDLIAAANAHHSIFDYRRALGPDGICVLLGGGYAQIFQVLLLGRLLSRMGNKKIRFFIAEINQQDLVFLKDLLEAGKIAPVIDRRYPLSGVADALRYRNEGHARGKVVITMEESDPT